MLWMVVFCCLVISCFDSFLIYIDRTKYQFCFFAPIIERLSSTILSFFHRDSSSLGVSASAKQLNRTRKDVKLCLVILPCGNLIDIDWFAFLAWIPQWTYRWLFAELPGWLQSKPPNVSATRWPAIGHTNKPLAWHTLGAEFSQTNHKNMWLCKIHSLICSYALVHHQVNVLLEMMFDAKWITGERIGMVETSEWNLTLSSPRNQRSTVTPSLPRLITEVIHHCWP